MSRPPVSCDGCRICFSRQATCRFPSHLGTPLGHLSRLAPRCFERYGSQGPFLKSQSRGSRVSFQWPWPPLTRRNSFHLRLQESPLGVNDLRPSEFAEGLYHS